MNRSYLRRVIREMVKEALESTSESTPEPSRWSYEDALERYSELLKTHLQSIKPSDYKGHPSGLGAYMRQRLLAGYDALDKGMLETGWTTQQIGDENMKRTGQRIEQLS